MIRYFFIIIVFITSFFSASAQPVVALTADDYYAYQDFNRALEEYLKLYKAKKDDIKTNLRIGICYLNVNEDGSKAIPYLQFVYNKGEYEKELLFQLGQAYAYDYNFDEAIKFFNEYRSKLSAKDYGLIDHYIANCETAKVMIKNPVNVTFENLGKEINSKYPDYSPCITKDESTIYFTSRRDGNVTKLKSAQGFFTADVYFSKVQNGQWTKAKGVGPLINTLEGEECVSITPDGKTMLLYMDNETSTGDLFITTFSTKSNTFPKPVLLDEPANSKNLEMEGYINQDENVLFVASDRSGGFGDIDIFMFKKLPNEKWGLPINLGPGVNTKYREAYPVFDEQNQILYFASQGHANMGGFDIFKSKFDPKTQTFLPAENMGYPINTPEDNMEFSFTKNKREGYIAAVRKEGIGNLDVYKVIFNDVDNKVSVITGIISTNYTDTLNKGIDATITLLNAKTKEEIDFRKINPKTGKYIFAVGPGKYILQVTADGFDEMREPISVYDKSDYIFEIEKNIILQKSRNIQEDTQGEIQPQKQD